MFDYTVSVENSPAIYLWKRVIRYQYQSGPEKVRQYARERTAHL